MQLRAASSRVLQQKSQLLLPWLAAAVTFPAVRAAVHAKGWPQPVRSVPHTTLRLASGCHLSPTNGACGYTGSFLSTTMMKLRSVGAIVAVTPQSSLYRSQFEGRQKGQKELTNVAHK